VRAFHRHYRGDENDVLDAEDARILYALTRLTDSVKDLPPAGAIPVAEPATLP
jgi:hypothetical protein